MRCLVCHLDGLPLDTVTCPGCRALLATVLRDCLPHGTLLHGGGYRLDYPLGRGGFGVTYRGVHELLSQVVAVKEFFPQEHSYRDQATGHLNIPVSKQEEFRKALQRFLDEGRILAGIRHSGVVRVLDLFEERGTAYLVMELAGTRTLRQELQSAAGARLPRERIRDLTRLLVEALDAVHAAGVAHLDVKPENVLLTPEGQPVLVDFGSARYHYGTEARTRSTTPYTEAYAAPELVAGRAVGPCSDLYELGVLVHELLTGGLPPGAITRMHDRKNSWAPDVDEEPWRGLLASALRLWPDERPASVREWWERSTTRPVVEDTAEAPVDPLEPPASEVAPAPSRESSSADPSVPESSSGPSIPVALPPPLLVSLGKNAQGFSEFRYGRDGSELVVVPAGAFIMGADDPEAYRDETPRHELTLPAFAIGKHEVTNRQFERFVAASGYEAGPLWRLYADRWGPLAPVVCVSWDDAQAYCRWAEARLPTEAEWEKAVRGPDGRRYPWGDSWDPERAWHGDNSGSQVHDVGSMPAGVSPYGCLDMAGNVWEWCSSVYRPYPYRSDDGREDPGLREHRVLRGGSWYLEPRSLRCSFRFWNDPGHRFIINGFRIVVPLSSLALPFGPTAKR